MNLRLKNLYSKLKQQKLDALLVSLPANISYLTGALSRDAYFLVSLKKNVYFTDSRYAEEAQDFLKNSSWLKVCNGMVFEQIGQLIKDLGLKKIGFEERYLPFAEFSKIKEQARTKFDLIPTHGLVEDLRLVKDLEEIKKIKAAAKITHLTLRYIQKFLVPGVKEVEVAGEIERFIRYQGATASAFEIIVASGPNSSKPHHLTGQRKLKKDDLVLIDLGVQFQGYKSDLTRVFFLGKISVLVRKVYEIVLKAQKSALQRIRSGAEMSEIDRVAREQIAISGFGKNFTHNLGHGVGLEIHEEPRISAREASALKPGMVFTIEPGVYLAGKFGVRIEDMVLVTKKGCEVL